MIAMRLRFKRLGGHVHCRLFTAPATMDRTFAKNGDLTFSIEEWPSVRLRLEQAHVEVLEEERTEE